MKINPSRRFDRQLALLVRKNTKYNSKVNKVLKLMDFDLKHPSLRTHKLQSTNAYSVSVDMKIRIIFIVDGDTAYLLQIGNHDEVY